MPEPVVLEPASFWANGLNVRSAVELATLLRLRAQETTFKIRRSRQGSCMQPNRSVGRELEVHEGGYCGRRAPLVLSEA